MNKKIFALVLACITLFLLGCEPDISGKDDKNNGGESDLPLEAGEVVFKGKVTSVDGRDFIEMEIIDSDIAFGTYWVLVGSETAYFDLEGNTVGRDSIKVNDVIEVVFSGQVMNSFPPKIAARKIYVH